MPPYAHMLKKDLDFDIIPRRMQANKTLGVPYSDAEINNGKADAMAQAAGIAARLERESAGLKGYEGKKIIAMIAYLERLGTDITKEPKDGFDSQEAK